VTCGILTISEMTTEEKDKDDEDDDDFNANQLDLIAVPTLLQIWKICYLVLKERQIFKLK